MNNEFSFEITNESKNAIIEILKQQGLRHFKLYTDFYGELDVINYEEYQKLEKEKDKEIERLSKEVDMWNRKYNEQIDIIIELKKDLIKEIDSLQDTEVESKEDIKCRTLCGVLDKLSDLIGELKEGK